MRVMTFNLRFENEKDGRFGWEFRRDFVVQVIRRHEPHILGTQEGTRSQLEFLVRRLSPEYEMVAFERVWDATCQYPTLFYRTKDFDLLSGGEFWLSRTPHVHRSKNWDSAFPRMLSYGRFREKQSRREFFTLVTHLDHLGEVARLEQSKLIGQWLKKQAKPCIVLGDFNDAPGSAVHKVLTEEGRLLVDTWQALSKSENERSMTRHDFQGSPEKFRMDWILHTPEFTVREAHILRDNLDGFYPSDHYPYMANLEWSDLQADAGRT